MRYRPIPQRIPAERREEINAKILFVIDSRSGALTPETIYNCYTGNGGLHGLDFKDFANYNEFKEAKQEAELGQFFTPAPVAERLVAAVQPQDGERVLDACCGMGAFFNFLPAKVKAYGNEIDPNAVKVARFLYPDADITLGDIRAYSPAEKMQVLLGNPPFGLHFSRDGKECLSQMYYCLKGADYLDTAGIMALVMPRSFLADVFWNRSDVDLINERFSFIGQTELPDDTFSALGVASYPTKIMVFHKRCESIPHADYDGSFCPQEELEARVAAFRVRKHAARLAIVRETLTARDRDTDSVMYEIRKCLYHIKSNPKTGDSYGKALEYIEKYRTQKPPQNATKEELEKWDREKITPRKILAYCRRLLRAQNSHPKDEIHIVYDRSGIRLKGYSPKMRALLKKSGSRGISRYDAVSRPGFHVSQIVPEELKPLVRDELAAAERRLRREVREFDRQSVPINDVEADAETAAYLDGVSFFNARMEECRLTDLQKADLGKVMQKRFAILNWQQGSGKTAASFFYARRLLDGNRVRAAFILAPALAINLTWVPFLRNNGVRFSVLRTAADVKSVERGTFALVSLSMVGTLKRELMHLTGKTLKNNACLVFDECDEITNPRAKRTKAVLDVFRRLRYKVLCTGTTTRNNIGELYSQLELLYNNSVNMLCLCGTVYSYDRDNELVQAPNDRYGMPFPPRGGSVLFRECFCPGKATVFGIEKTDQNVFNAEELRDITDRTITTRRFQEFAGDKYSIHNVRVTPTSAEKAVYRKITDELESLIPVYFKSTGDSRKEAALRLVRTITLMIRSCSTPNLMPGYSSDELPTKVRKILEMLDERAGAKVVVGCTTIESLDVYRDVISDAFPERPLFVVDGSVPFGRRDRTLKEFEATRDGILVCTQQSLKSSVNIPTCNEVIIEALQWNIPKIQQFFFRTIRFDSEDWTNVHFVTYEDTIEQNILALLMTKERLNEFLRCGEVRSRDDMLAEYGLNDDILSMLVGKSYDKDGNLRFTWGRQEISA